MLTIMRRSERVRKRFRGRLYRDGVYERQALPWLRPLSDSSCEKKGYRYLYRTLYSFILISLVRKCPFFNGKTYTEENYLIGSSSRLVLDDHLQKNHVPTSPPLCNQLVYQNTRNFAQDLSQYFTHFGKNKEYVCFWVALYFVFFSPEVMPFIVLFWQNAKWYKKASSNLRKNHLPGVDASNVCFFMCLFKPRDTLHVKSHLLQAKGSSPVWESM